MTSEIIFEFRIELNKNYVYKYPTTINNIPMEVEIINLSDDESNNGDQPRISENIEEPKHIRKTADFKWFAEYPWLRTESVNGNTMLFCKICREYNGITTFARGTSLLRINKIREPPNIKNLKNHLNQMLQDN